MCARGTPTARRASPARWGRACAPARVRAFARLPARRARVMRLRIARFPLTGFPNSIPYGVNQGLTKVFMGV